MSDKIKNYAIINDVDILMVFDDETQRLGGMSISLDFPMTSIRDAENVREDMEKSGIGEKILREMAEIFLQEFKEMPKEFADHITMKYSSRVEERVEDHIEEV